MPARKAQCNNFKRTGHFAKVYRSKTVSRIQAEETGSNTDPWPEIDHIQPGNSVNRIDLQTILLVEEQPIEVIIDTGTPVTIIPYHSKRYARDYKKFCRCEQKPNKV